MQVCIEINSLLDSSFHHILSSVFFTLEDDSQSSFCLSIPFRDFFSPMAWSSLACESDCIKIKFMFNCLAESEEQEGLRVRGIHGFDGL